MTCNVMFKNLEKKTIKLRDKYLEAINHWHI